MNGKICASLMKASAVMAGVVGLLRAARWPGAGCVLRDLRSEEELREDLRLMFEGGDFLGAREMMQSEEVCPRVESLGGYFVMAGMMLTDGAWHSRYVKIFKKTKVDLVRDEEMTRWLVSEMATGEIWKETSKELRMELGTTAFRILEEGQGRRPTTLGDHIGPVIGKWLRPANGRWGTVLKKLLKEDGLLAGVMEGRYNESLREMMRKDVGVAHVFYAYTLGKPNVLRNLMDRNVVLGREVMASAIERGYWLYMGELESAMKTQRIGELLGEDDVFGKIRAVCGLDGEELSIGRLKALAREGRLNRTVTALIGRLIVYEEVHDLRRLMVLWGLMVFSKGRLDEILCSGELDGVLKERAESLIRDGDVYHLKILMELSKGRLDGLLSGGELDAALKEGAERLISGGEMCHLESLVRFSEGRLNEMVTVLIEKLVKNGQASDLKRLMEHFGKRFDDLLSSGKLDAPMKESAERLIKDGKTHGLEMLLGLYKGRLDEMLSSGRLDAALRAKMEELIKDQKKYDLERLIGFSKGRFDELLSSGKLDAALRARAEKLIRYERIHDLEELAEFCKGRLDEVLSSGRLDAALRARMEELIKDGPKRYLEMLIGLSKGRFDELLSSGRLDAALRARAEKLIRDDKTYSLEEMAKIYDLEELAGFCKGRLDELLSSGRLDAALKERAENLVRSGQMYDLEKLMGLSKGRLDEMLSSGRLDLALKERAEKLIKDGQADDLKKLMGRFEKRLDVMLSSGRLDAALKERAEKQIKYGQNYNLKKLMGLSKGRLDGLLSSGELDAALRARMEELVEYKRMDDLKMMMGIEAVKRRVFGGLLSGEGLDTVKRLTGPSRGD